MTWIVLRTTARRSGRRSGRRSASRSIFVALVVGRGEQRELEGSWEARRDRVDNRLAHSPQAALSGQARARPAPIPAACWVGAAAFLFGGCAPPRPAAGVGRHPCVPAFLPASGRSSSAVRVVVPCRAEGACGRGLGWARCIVPLRLRRVSRRFNVSMDQLSKDELELELPPPPAGDR